MDAVTQELSQLIAVALGGLTSIVMAGLRRANRALDQASPILKSVVVLLLTQGVALLGDLVGLPVSGNPLNWGPETVNTLLMWLSAMGLHAGAKALRESLLGAGGDG